jgi:hypothetical protein
VSVLLFCIKKKKQLPLFHLHLGGFVEQCVLVSAFDMGCRRVVVRISVYRFIELSGFGVTGFIFFEIEDMEK